MNKEKKDNEEKKEKEENIKENLKNTKKEEMENKNENEYKEEKGKVVLKNAVIYFDHLFYEFPYKKLTTKYNPLEKIKGTFESGYKNNINKLNIISNEYYYLLEINLFCIYLSLIETYKIKINEIDENKEKNRKKEEEKQEQKVVQEEDYEEENKIKEEDKIKEEEKEIKFEDMEDDEDDDEEEEEEKEKKEEKQEEEEEEKEDKNEENEEDKNKNEIEKNEIKGEVNKENKEEAKKIDKTNEKNEDKEKDKEREEEEKRKIKNKINEIINSIYNFIITYESKSLYINFIDEEGHKTYIKNKYDELFCNNIKDIKFYNDDYKSIDELRDYLLKNKKFSFYDNTELRQKKIIKQKINFVKKDEKVEGLTDIDKKLLFNSFNENTKFFKGEKSNKISKFFEKIEYDKKGIDNRQRKNIIKNYIDNYLNLIK